MEAVNRTVALANFYGDGKHLYEDELGWWPSVKEEAHSMISRDIFEYEIVHIGLNLAFYYIDNDTCYGLHTESLPIEFKILPMDKSQKNTCWQCEFDTHDDGEVLFSFDELSMNIWDTIRIDGKKLGEVLERSIIMTRD